MRQTHPEAQSPEETPTRQNLTFAQLLPIFITVVLATLPAIGSYYAKESQKAQDATLVQYKIAELQTHQAKTDEKVDSVAAKVDTQAITLNTLLNNQGQGREKLDSVATTLKDQAREQELFREDIQRLTAAMQARNNGK